MKFALRWCVVPLIASALLAQTAPKQKSKKPGARATVTAADVQALKDALAAQQSQIEQLRQEMQTRDAALQQAQQQAQQAQQQLQQTQAAATDAQAKAASVESAWGEQKSSVSRLNDDMADVKTTLTNSALSAQDEQKRVSAIEGLLGRFRFNGDVRVRGESFFQDFPNNPDRNRGRIRVRFGFDGKLNEDFSGGIYLATGSLGDPTTTNETLTNFFDRKTIGLDRGFITYNPIAHKWINITGGKFAYSWNRTSVTFDPDLNPEGFSEKLSWDLRMPVVKNFTVQAMQLLFNESNSGSTAKARQDSYALGAQVSAKFVIGPWTATPSFLSLKWNRPDSILQASAFAVQATTTGVQGTTPSGPFNVPGEGPGCAGAANIPSPNVPPCPFAPNGMTNATFIDSSGHAHFFSGFNYADFILNNVVKTGIARLPLNVLAEYEQNLDAEDHPLDSKGNVLTGLGSQNKAYLVDVSLGQLKNKNDIQFGYAFLRQEQDSVIASFNESDQRAPTNILQHRFYVNYRIRNNTTAGFTWWHGRTLNTALENAAKVGGLTTGATEPYLNRLQFDLVYSF
jgi:hypothetical protein